MSDQPDRLLAALAALEHEDDLAHPDAWDDVLLGRSSVDEAISAASERPADEQAMLAALFTAPISAQQVGGMVERVLADWQPAAPKVIPLHRRRAMWTGTVTALAAAAALFLWMRPEPSPNDEFVDYSLTLRSPSVQDDRASARDVGVPRYRGDSQIDWVLSPRGAVVGEHVVRVLARDDSGHERLLAPATDMSPEGVVRLVGRLDTLLSLDPGRWHLSFLITTAGAAPRDPASAAAIQPVEQLEIDVLPPR